MMKAAAGRLARAGVALAGGASAAGTLLGFLARHGTPFELASHFRLQYLLALLVASAVLASRRRYEGAAAAGLLAAVNLALVARFARDPAAPAPDSEGRPVRALLFNVGPTHGALRRIEDLIRATDPDVILLVEPGRAWRRVLDDLHATYPHGAALLRDDPGGLALLSRIPLETVQFIDLGVPDRPIAVARTAAGQIPLTLVGVHPPAGRDALRTARRQRLLVELGRRLSREERPTVVLGDLNVTPWAPLYEDFLEGAGLRDSREGFGLLPTWPAFFPPLWLPLDYCLVSPEIGVAGFRRGGYAGSDHLPVIVDLIVPATLSPPDAAAPGPGRGGGEGGRAGRAP